MAILEDIIAYKEKEVAEKKALYPVKLLEKSLHYRAPVVSLRHYLQREDKCGVIAEIKRKSPSRGIINNYVSIERTSIGYMQAGAAALSILTDHQFFGGSNEDLMTARRFNFCPILRKDFIIDEYQIIEARSIGADVILLIAAALEPEKLKNLATFAKSLGLEVLLEVHNEVELRRNLHGDFDVIGVNNRDLKTFKVSVTTSKMLSAMIPDSFLRISESGISSPDTILDLIEYGYQGFLIGEYFMRHSRPEKACAEFVQKIKQLQDALPMKK